MRLTTMIYERLPREIRDIIYQYVYIEDALIPIGSHHFTTYRPPMRSIAPPVDLQADRPFIKIPEGAETIDHSMGPPDMILPTDRTLDPAYIHNKVLYEAAEMYYSSNTFSICTISNAISAFLLSDHANNFSPPEDQKQARPLGLRPIDHVRNLQIRIKCEHYDRYLDKERQINLYLDTLSNLTPLAKCVTNTGIDDSQSPLKRNIEFIIMTNLHAGIRLSEQFRRFLNILETIRSTIYTLKHDCGADLHILHHDPELSTFPRTITSIFMLSKEQWEYVRTFHILPSPFPHRSFTWSMYLADV